MLGGSASGVEGGSVTQGLSSPSSWTTHWGPPRDLGISDSVLRKWIKAAQQQGQRAFPGHGRQLLTPEQEEIKRLRSENEILRQEREILKKAAAFFAKESR